MKKRRRIGRIQLTELLLIIAVVLLCLSLFGLLKMKEIIDNDPKPKPTPEPTADTTPTPDPTPDTTPTPEPTPEPTPTPKPLPSELTDLNSITLLVNRSHGLAANYVPSDLVSPYLPGTSEVIQLRAECAEKAKEMIKAAADDGVNLYVMNGYISYYDQKEIYDNLVNLVGEKTADTKEFKPGFSEHQTGLCIDFTDSLDHVEKTTAFSKTPACQWLLLHGREYGFIERYPADKQKLTGYSYMPWHYRYIGVEAAQGMTNAHVHCFEDYYGITE